MARQSISQARSQADFINGAEIDLMGESQDNYTVVTLDAIADRLAYLGALYTQKLQESLSKVDASSSGKLADSIMALDVKIFGSIYTVEIQAAKYAKYIDEGINGWAKSRGSKYTFRGSQASGKRTKKMGPTPLTEMQKNVKEWLIRESSFARQGFTTTAREKRNENITDTTTRAAISAAFMIKRQGIKPTHFWRDATKEMRSIVEIELGKALKVDIINSITV